MIETSIAALGGAAWRWWDGRGYLPGWVRLFACYAIAVVISRDAGLVALVIALAFAAIWTPRQKHRENLLDMLERWGGAFTLLGCLIAAVTGNPDAALWMMGAGMLVALLVVIGVKWDENFWLPGPDDPAALTEAIAGAVAFTALAAAV